LLSKTQFDTLPDMTRANMTAIAEEILPASLLIEQQVARIRSPD